MSSEGSLSNEQLSKFFRFVEMFVVVGALLVAGILKLTELMSLPKRPYEWLKRLRGQYKSR